MKTITICLSLALVMGLPGLALAQEVERPPLVQVLRLTIDYHVPELVLLLLSFVVVFLVIERIATLVVGADRILSRAVMRLVCQLSKETTLSPAQKQEVLSLCQVHPSAFSTVVSHGVQRSGRSLAEIEAACTQVLAMENSHLGRATGYLQLVGRLAPFIGLLGTVIGVMAAFFENAMQANVGHDALARGISTALTATAGGIVVTVLAIAAGHLFRQRQNRIFDSMVALLLPFLPLVADSERS